MEEMMKRPLIRLSKSCLGEAEKLAVQGVLDREYLGMGSEVEQFEYELSDFFGRQAVCVASGTAAIHLALQAVGIGPGDEVLVQSLTYVASFQAVSATGAKAVACDVNQEDLTIDLQDAEARLSKNTKAIMPVHYAGGTGELDKIYHFAERHGLRVIEDAAHAFGSEYQGKRVGGFGDVSCFSFDGIKNITSGEGGCIVTDDVEVLQRVRDARLLGVEKDSEKRYSGERSWEFDVDHQGWRYHMSNIMAAIGIEQLRKFPDFCRKRQSLAKTYDRLLSGISGISVYSREYQSVVPHIYVVRLNRGVDRKKLREQLAEHNIQTGVHYQPNHWLSKYHDREVVELQNVDAIYPQLLTLPLHPDLTENDVLYVCESLKECMGNV